jgi:hypothetical protein
MTKLRIAFHNFAKAPKNLCFWSVCVCESEREGWWGGGRGDYVAGSLLLPACRAMTVTPLVFAAVSKTPAPVAPAIVAAGLFTIRENCKAIRTTSHYHTQKRESTNAFLGRTSLHAEQTDHKITALWATNAHSVRQGVPWTQDSGAHVQHVFWTCTLVQRT